MSMTIAPPPSHGTLPKVGQQAPDFALPDSTGTARRLSDLVAVGPLVLLFYRGHW
jgi:peroxiredoxin